MSKMLNEDPLFTTVEAHKFVASACDPEKLDFQRVQDAYVNVVPKDEQKNSNALTMLEMLVAIMHHDYQNMHEEGVGHE